MLDLSPRTTTEPAPLALEAQSLYTGPPGKPQLSVFINLPVLDVSYKLDHTP